MGIYLSSYDTELGGIMRVAVLAHIFWEDSWDAMKGYFFNLMELQGVEPIFIINTCFEVVANDIRQDLPEAHVLVSENRGRDIGGVFMALDFYFKHKICSDYMIVTHDKKSSPNDFIFLMTMLHKDVIPIVLNRFNKKTVGMIGAKCKHYCNLEYIEADLLDQYCNTFGLLNMQKGLEDIKYYGFIAGTIFWVRSSIFESFFSLNDPLKLTLDIVHDYRVMYIMERIFGFLVTDYGYSITNWEDKMPKFNMML